MQSKKQSGLKLDFIFLFFLFGIFIISALLVIVFGAKIYSNTTIRMDDDFFNGTGRSYITEKIHQYDFDNSFEISTDENGNTILKLPLSGQSSTYITYLYVYDHAFREITLPSSDSLDKKEGTPLFACEGFQARQCKNNIYQFHLWKDATCVNTFYVTKRCNATEGIAHE